MFDDLKPYPAMKDSGVPWLGEVPEHWHVRRLKRDVRINPSKSEAAAILEADARVTFLPMERVGTEGQIDAREVRPASSLWNGLTYFRRNDVLVAKITPCFENGKGACLEALPTEVGFGSTEFVVLRATATLLPQFLYRITTLSQFRKLGADAMTGAAGQQRVPPSFMAAFLAAIPPLPEQSVIVRFLDHTDRRIRRYIRAKHKLIKLLEERKQAIIHRVVTCGLDPNVRLKLSGIGWLGHIPEHWTIKRNGRLFAQRNQTGFAELPILEVSLRTGVRIRNFESSDRKQVMSDLGKYKRAVSGDIAYNMMRMWQGAVGVVPVDGLVSPAYIVARPLDGTDPRYFSNLFRTPAYMREVDAYSRGIVKDRNRLYWEDFKQMASPCPPANEQARIANAIEQMTRFLEEAVRREIKEIELLLEFRTLLIADVVTGKLDVREATTKLAEEAGQAEPLEEADVLVEGDEDSSEADTEVATEEAEA